MTLTFYTGLPDYAAFIALYNFVKPKPGFRLNYFNGYTNARKDPSYIVSRGRSRNLCELDELFLTLTASRFAGERPWRQVYHFTVDRLSVLLSWPAYF